MQATRGPPKSKLEDENWVNFFFETRPKWDFKWTLLVLLVELNFDPNPNSKPKWR